MTLRADAATMRDDLVALRRSLHRTPELGLKLPQTEALVLEALDDLPLDVEVYGGFSGIVAVLHGDDPGPVVLLRADMDALPLTEMTDLEFASPEPRMHACGHDLHTAMLVGAARLLVSRRADVRGSVVFMFQPGEEIAVGAQRMLDAGILTAAKRPVDAAYALHVTPAVLPFGTVATRPGTLLSAVGALRVTVKGAGGHGSRPHRAKDPVPAAAEMITALQTLVTRQFDAFDPVIVSVGVLRAGTKINIIPETAYFEAAVRTFSEEHSTAIGERVIRLCRGIAEAHGLSVDAEFEPLAGCTVNDAVEAARFLRVAASLFGAGRVLEYAHPQPGSEDFANVLARVPGAMAFLGACPVDGDPATAAYNHSPHAVYDDSIVGDGAALLAAMALDRLSP